MTAEQQQTVCVCGHRAKEHRWHPEMEWLDGPFPRTYGTCLWRWCRCKQLEPIGPIGREENATSQAGG